MSDKRTNQTSDHAQTGGGLQPGQTFTNLYRVKPASLGQSGATSPNSADRGKEHTRG